MPEAEDLKSHALKASQDFYALLDLHDGATEKEIRSAYRKTARKYHPDKVGADPEALEKFHLLAIAYDVLSDPAIRELYDNARRARQAKVDRDQLFEGRRKAMKEDLERRENGAAWKRKREDDAEAQFERELNRLAEDGKRRRKEREEQLRREADKTDMEDKTEKNGEPDGAANGHEFASTNGSVADIDRSITFRFLQSDTTKHIDRDEIVSRFERFGQVDEVVLREKKLKVDGEKHRRLYTTAVLVYRSAVGAHAAVSDLAQMSEREPERYGLFERVAWAAGKEPDFIPRPPTGSAGSVRPRFDPDAVRAATNGHDLGSMKAPSFGSFKAGMQTRSAPSLDEITMIRLKNAERRRLEEKIRQDEAAAAQANGQEADGVEQ